MEEHVPYIPGIYAQKLYICTYMSVIYIYINIHTCWCIVPSCRRGKTAAGSVSHDSQDAYLYIYIRKIWTVSAIHGIIQTIAGSFVYV